MKTIHIIITILLATLAIGVTSCKDDEPLPLPGPGDEAYIELSSINTFQDISTTGAGTWEVTEHPEWASPMEESGKCGKDVTLFVQTNDEDDDRTAALRIKFSDGTEKVYTLMQHGLISDDSNGAITEAKNLKKTYGVGYPVNVFAKSTAKYSTKSTTPLDFAALITALKAAGEPDALVMEDRFFSRVESVTGTSVSSLANQMSINAGIEVGISAFKLSISGGFSTSSSESSNYVYAIEEIQHIVGTCQLRPGVLRYCVDNGINIFQPTFVKLCNRLKENPNDTKTMDLIINTYGTHLITQGSLGGELRLSMQMSTTSGLSESDIHAALGLSNKVLDVNGEFKMNEKDSVVATNTSISLRTYGGNNTYTLNPGTNFPEFQSYVKKQENLSAWVSSIRDGKSVTLVDMEAMPIYELLPTQEARDAMREYIMGPYQTKINVANGDENYAGPDLYVLKGFNVDAQATKEASVVIPELDMEVVAFHGIVPELSTDEYSTVIYSGSNGNVSRRKGFFIGSATRKPCKFSRDNKGKFTVEEFSSLSKGALSELYADATGDITIFPKSVGSLYRNVAFPEWDKWWDYYDLAQLDEPITISKPTVLTGHSGVFLEQPIIIGADVTVRLHNAHLEWGGFECKGNATIHIDEDTDNIIDARSYDFEELPAIKPGPSGTTLTIEGNGKLAVYGNAAGIGCAFRTSCGHITINSGDITVIGQEGPAIGPNFSSACGNITINGGTVTAFANGYGMYPAAAIGTGGPSSACGNIFISRNVHSVTAEAHHGALAAIGNGTNGGSCGKITIEDPKKVVQQTFKNS